MTLLMTLKEASLLSVAFLCLCEIDGFLETGLAILEKRPVDHAVNSKHGEEALDPIVVRVPCGPNISTCRPRWSST